VFGDRLFDAKKNAKGILNILCMLRILKEEYDAEASVGYKSGGMDGGAFLGLRTYTICETRDIRMNELACFSEFFIPVKAFPHQHGIKKKAKKEWHFGEEGQEALRKALSPDPAPRSTALPKELEPSEETLEAVAISSGGQIKAFLDLLEERVQPPSEHKRALRRYAGNWFKFNRRKEGQGK
jgi:hypothetical protein